MPINRLLGESNLDPKQIELLNVAFNRALRALRLVDRDDPVCEIVARKVIEFGLDGFRDPQEIAKAVVTALTSELSISD